MKLIFTFLLIIATNSLKAQTPLCEVHHGCGGATVVAYQGESTINTTTHLLFL
jgi:hypothetical protein